MPYIASMGIYVLKASAIKKLLREYFPNVSLVTSAGTAAACPYNGSHPCQYAALLPISADVLSLRIRHLDPALQRCVCQLHPAHILLENLLSVGRQRHAQPPGAPHACIYSIACCYPDLP